MLPARIEALKTRIAEPGASLQDPATYQRGGEGWRRCTANWPRVQAELDAALRALGRAGADAGTPGRSLHAPPRRAGGAVADRARHHPALARLVFADKG